MKIIHIIDSTQDGEQSPFADTYIVSFDPEFHHLTAPDGYGGGKLRVTMDRSQAMKFIDVVAALEYWKQGPTCANHATRADGKQNRPLTAFTISVEDADA